MKHTSRKDVYQVCSVTCSYVVYAALHVYMRHMSHVAYIRSYVSMFDILHAI